MIFQPLWDMPRRSPMWGMGRKGYLRPLILKLLSEREMSGVEMIDEVYSRTIGLLDPSPGSIYPLLSKMAEEGLIEISAERDGKKIYRISQKGRDILTKYLEQGHWIWRVFEEEYPPITELGGYLREALRELNSALKEATRAGRRLKTETLKSIADTLSKTAENIRKLAESDRTE